MSYKKKTKNKNNTSINLFLFFIDYKKITSKYDFLTAIDYYLIQIILIVYNRYMPSVNTKNKIGIYFLTFIRHNI